MEGNGRVLIYGTDTVGTDNGTRTVGVPFDIQTGHIPIMSEAFPQYPILVQRM
jgi:hypothetical protein